MKRETQGLCQRGCFENANIDEPPSEGNILPSQFVLSLKSAGTPMEQRKARLFCTGPHGLQNVEQLAWRCCTRSFVAAYWFNLCLKYGLWHLVSRCKSSININRRATKWLGIPETSEVIQACWYHLVETGRGALWRLRLWRLSVHYLSKHSTDDLHLICIPTNRASYGPESPKRMAALRLILNDTLMCGDDAFWELTGKIAEELWCEVKGDTCLELADATITTEVCDYLGRQAGYAGSLNAISMDTTI